MLDAADLLPTDELWLPALVAALLAIAAAFAYRRSDAIRRFLTLLSLAAPIFPLIFLFSSPLRGLLLPGASEALTRGPMPS